MDVEAVYAGVSIMQAAMVVTWTRPVLGREMRAIEYGAEVQEFWGAKAAEGACSDPEMFFSERGLGMWMVKGDLDTLRELRESDESRRLTAMGGYLLEEFCVDFYLTGDGADDYLGRYANVVAELG